MNKASMIGAYVIAFLLKPVLDGIIPGNMGTGNILLCLTSVLVFLYDEYVPVILTGTVFALLDDLVYGLYCGPEALGTLAVCCAIITARYIFNNENYVNAFIVLIVSTWLAYSVEWGVYHFAGVTYSYAYMLKSIPVSVIVNTVIGMVVYFVLHNRIRKRRYDKYYDR